jgi:hypothetical protein
MLTEEMAADTQLTLRRSDGRTRGRATVDDRSIAILCTSRKNPQYEQNFNAKLIKQSIYEQIVLPMNKIGTHIHRIKHHRTPGASAWFYPRLSRAWWQFS